MIYDLIQSPHRSFSPDGVPFPGNIVTYLYKNMDSTYGIPAARGIGAVIDTVGSTTHGHCQGECRPTVQLR